MNRTLSSPLSRALVVIATASSPAWAQEAPPADVSPRDVLAELAPTPAGLTADGAAKRAIEVAPIVRQAHAREAQAKYAQLAGATFAPRLDLQANYTRLSRVEQPVIEFGGMEFSLFPQILNNYSARASVSVPITDTFLTTLPTYRAAQHGFRAAEHQAEFVAAQTALQARQAFYSFVRSKATALVAEDAVRLLSAHIEDLQALLEAGQVTRADLLQAQAQNADAMAQLASSRGAVQVSEDQLRRLLNYGPDVAIEVGEDVFASLRDAVPSKESLLQSAMSGRSDVLAMRSLLRAQKQRIRSARGARYPKLRLVGGVNYANPNQRINPQSENFDATWDAGIVLSWSPNDYISGRVPLEQGQLEMSRIENDFELLEDQLAVEASQTSSDLRVAQRRLESSKKGVESAMEAWRVRHDLMGAGESTPSDVLDAEAILRRAQINLVDAYIALRIADARIRYVKGTASKPL